MKNYEIFFGDCRQILKNIPDASVNVVITSPPYNIGKPYGKYKDKITLDLWTDLIKEVTKEVFRILKPNGLVITFGYHSNTMGKNRGFEVERIALFSHGGAIHDTIASVERHCR